MNQVLVIGSSQSGKLTLVEELFGDQVEIPKDLTSHSGLIFNDIKIETKYFKTQIGLWIDEYNERDGSAEIQGLKNWCNELKSEEAKEIRDVLKGLIFTFNSSLTDAAEYASQASDLLGDLVDNYFDNWDGIKVALGFQKDNTKLTKEKLQEFDDIWLGNGFEFIWFEEKTEDDLKLGKERLLEILETNEWRSVKKSTSDPDPDLNDDNFKQMFTRLLDDYDDKDLLEKDIDYDELANKLRNAKVDISKIENDNEKRKAALDAITNALGNL